MQEEKKEVRIGPENYSEGNASADKAQSGDANASGHKEHRDEKESYLDYNGNSEANNPQRAQEGDAPRH